MEKKIAGQSDQHNHLITPDGCSSTRCSPPKAHCMQCSHAVFYGEVYANGRRWPFEFSPMFGVFFTRISDGEPKAVQPNESHPVWDAWEKWHKDRFDL